MFTNLKDMGAEQKGIRGRFLGDYVIAGFDILHKGEALGILAHGFVMLCIPQCKDSVMCDKRLFLTYYVIM